MLRQASLYGYEGSVSVISRDSLSDVDIDLDSSDSCRCLSDRFYIALNWDSSSTYREPLSLQKLPPVPTSPRHYDLASCLQSFSREETLSQNDSWRCPRCKKSVEATSSIGLWRTPDVLVIHLKRFLCTARWREKLRTDILVPETGPGPLQVLTGGCLRGLRPVWRHQPSRVTEWRALHGPCEGVALQLGRGRGGVGGV